MKARNIFISLVLGCLVLTLTTSALAQSITTISPPRVAAGAGQIITIFGTLIGHPGDIVEFPGGAAAPPLRTDETGLPQGR